MTQPRTPVYRHHDHELLGFVQAFQHEWHALTVFGTVVARCPDYATAHAYLDAHGLALLNQHWHYYEAQTHTWHVVLIQEASPTHVQLVLGYYAMPGIPTKVLTSADIHNGDILQLHEPTDEPHPPHDENVQN